MPAWQDYPRMMFHRTRPPVTVKSRDEEDALGAEWSRTLWPVDTEVSHPAAPKEPDRPSLTYNKLTVDEPPWEGPPAPVEHHEAKAPKQHKSAPEHHEKPKAARFQSTRPRGGAKHS